MKIKSKKKVIVTSIVSVLVLTIFTAFMTQVGYGGKYQDKNGKYNHLKTSTSYSHIYNHPIWEGSGRDFFSSFPDDKTTSITSFMSVKALCHWCKWDSKTTIDALNYMLDKANEGKTGVYNVYSEEERKEKSYLDRAKLFFMKGEKDKPLAIIAAGGGYTTVRSDTEAFPYAWKLNELGYNVFVLRYRVGEDLAITGNEDVVQEASKDMIRAISYIKDNSYTFDINMDNYTLWGSSAGGGIISAFSYQCQKQSFDELSLPRPAAQMLIYTHAAYFDKLTFQKDDVPTFTIVGENDTYSGDIIMDRKVPQMEAAGMKVEYHKYKDYVHGTGLGIGTSAENWIYDAVDFWNDMML